MTTHPSSFDLDFYKLGIATDHATHIAACVHCQAYLVAIEGTAIGSPPVRQRAPSKRWQWLPIFAAAAACTLLLVTQRQDDVVAKGDAPAVSVFVKRDAAIARWDGRAPVREGDALQLEAIADGYSQAAIVAHDDHGQRRVLVRSPLLGRKQALGASLIVDATREPEAMQVVFSRTLLRDEEALAAAARVQQDANIWVLSLRFEKE